jgi:hypothetical protein
MVPVLRIPPTVQQIQTIRSVSKVAEFLGRPRATALRKLAVALALVQVLPTVPST